jgi:hypothetical protein
MTQGMFRFLTGRLLAVAGLAAAVSILGSGTAHAQLDPLLALKRVPPNVVVVVDTSFRMLDDGDGNYYDPQTYKRTDDITVANALGVTSQTYRRIYKGLGFENTQDSNSKYLTTDIVAVQSSSSQFASFWAATRLEIAKKGIAEAVSSSALLVRWGLLKLRQASPAWRALANCDKPVRVTGNVTLASTGDTSPCAVGGLGLGGRYGISAPSTAGAGFGIETPPGDAIVVPTPTASVATSNAGLLTIVERPVLDPGLSLIPAGRDTSSYQDRAISHALDDARAHVAALMTAEVAATKACRNNVVVLIAGGKDDGDTAYADSHDPVSVAGTFAAVTAGGVTRRVPIVVIGVKPDPADEIELMAIAAASGGKYFKVTTAGEVAFALNYATQLGFQQAADLDGLLASEYSFLTPIVGTVNLEGASDVNGVPLPNTVISSTQGATTGQAVPQRSNMLLTAGFDLPNFDGRLRAFRSFKPEADTTKATGWRFVQDGTRLWPDLDGRPALAGIARAPANASSRNIFTFIPNGAGGGAMVEFTAVQAATLAPHLGGADPATLIAFIRSQPIGALVGSTPAVMDPPSLDPPPDADYGAKDQVGSFVDQYKDRRSMIFFGANDGMVHAVDARTGYEVWAFIPYNLLPKLQALLDGQSVEQFDYFVDSSPKIAEVKIGGAWRTMLVIGQSYGGTFYQAFDVTNAGTGVSATSDGLTAVNSMLARFDAPDETIQFSWAFPNYSSFDPNVTLDTTLTDSGATLESAGFPGGRARFYGDVKSTATSAEKRVGFSFSDPAVGPMAINRSLTAVITASGYFPDVENQLAGRGPSAPRAGRALFVLNAATGLPVGNASGACTGIGCFDVGDVANGRKNAIQADVTAAGDIGSPIVTKAYVGDVDGRYRRFRLQADGTITATLLHDAGQPIYSSSALLFVGTSLRYLFFGTGSDILSAAAPGGGSSGTGTAFKLLGVQDSNADGVAGTVTVSKNLSPKVVSTGLLTNGERPTSSPTVAGDIVFFATTTDSAAASCTDATAKIYAFTFQGTAAYDSNGNGTLDNNESPVVATSVGRATAPFIVDQHLFIGTSSVLGAGVTMLGDPEDFNNGVGQVGIRILSWREIR